VNRGGLANESLFAIILETFHIRNSNMYAIHSSPNTYHINASATISDWTHMSSPTSPNIFRDATDENIQLILDLKKENTYAMFLRKVHRTFPDAEIKKIWVEKEEHKYMFPIHCYFLLLSILFGFGFYFGGYFISIANAFHNQYM
jgi:hypothetical protein